MVEALFGGLVGTILGTVLGVLLSEWITKRRENRNEEKQAKSAGTMPRLEIERNLESLGGLWVRVTQIRGSIQDPDRRKVAFARNLVLLPLECKREALESQLSFLPVALSDGEVMQVLETYDGYDWLEAIRHQLALALENQQDEQRAATSGPSSAGPIVRYAFATPFDSLAIILWDECESIVDRLRTEGNPLA